MAVTQLFWRLRYWLACKLLSTGMVIMPPCRYKTELNAALWVIGLRVQATVAAARAAPHEMIADEQD
jgi:hypothetical protein